MKRKNTGNGIKYDEVKRTCAIKCGAHVVTVRFVDASKGAKGKVK